ncbi:general substrate transporter [Aspergillus ellipticus CBS 707.79]|uniref:General substrate transporter n=1 Tax=Aspergillus ellipticus CBS 707.79 TaxID=1448320 RepID=A0A319DGK3_9EURO|nr:general substrate transporter [Aspergillus ellipticus CBS 707.79]
MTQQMKNDTEQNATPTTPSDHEAWWRKPHLLRLNAIIAGLLLYSSTVGYDGSLMNGLQSLEQWQDFTSHPTGAWLGFINATQFFGIILGLPLQAWAANRFGRKPTIFIGYFFLAIGAGLQGSAKDPAIAWFQVAVVLITEIAYSSHRSKVSASYQCQYYIGSILAAWLTFGCRNRDSSWAWRIPSVMQLGIPLAALPFAVMSPESPRWLVSQDRHEKARRMLIKYYAGGDESSALVMTQMDEINSSIAAEREAGSSASWVDMVKTGGNRRRFIITVTLGVFAQWNGVGIISYYLTLILDSIGIASVTDQLMIDGYLQLWNFILAIVGASLVDRVGRRSLFLLSTIIMLVCYIVITGLAGGFATTNSSPVGISLIPFLFLYCAGYDIAFTPLVMAYPAEILTAACTYFALLFNSFVNPIALDAIRWKYYIVYIALLILILVFIYLMYPETRGHSLESMAAIFDGDETTRSARGEGEA